MDGQNNFETEPRPVIGEPVAASATQRDMSFFAQILPRTRRTLRTDRRLSDSPAAADELLGSLTTAAVKGRLGPASQDRLLDPAATAEQLEPAFVSLGVVVDDRETQSFDRLLYGISRLVLPDANKPRTKGNEGNEA